MNTNPYMMMLKADPKRYICRPSATVLVLIKAVEGGFAAFCLLRLLLSAAGAGFAGTVADLFLSPLPSTLLPWALTVKSAMGETLFVIAALCCLTALVCMVIDAAALLALRFALSGAGVLKAVHQLVFGTCCCLVFTIFAGLALRIYRFFTLEFSKDPTLVTVRPVLIVGASALIVMVLLTQYHRDVMTVFSAIEYELRLEFKETMIDAPVLGKYSALFSIAFLAGAVLLGLKTEPGSPLVIGMGILAVKYFSVSQSWEIFRRCHR